MIDFKIILNGQSVETQIEPDAKLYDTLRSLGCLSVKCGCETSGCGMCTVIIDGKPMLSCSIMSARVNGASIITLEGMQDRAKAFAECMADEGADQCGFCNPGFVMNVLAMEDELTNPTDDEIRKYLLGNLCRCTGYVSQERAIKKYLQIRRG